MRCEPGNLAPASVNSREGEWVADLTGCGSKSNPVDYWNMLIYEARSYVILWKVRFRTGGRPALGPVDRQLGPHLNGGISSNRPFSRPGVRKWRDSNSLSPTYLLTEFDSNAARHENKYVYNYMLLDGLVVFNVAGSFCSCHVGMSFTLTHE